MRTKPTTIADEFWYRGALGLIGALLGCFAGMLIALPLMYFAVVSTSLAKAVLAGSLAGAIVGALAPSTLIYGVQAFMYFVLGFLGAMAGGSGIDPPTPSPKWLWVAFVFGVAYFAALVIL